MTGLVLIRFRLYGPVLPMRIIGLEDGNCAFEFCNNLTMLRISGITGRKKDEPSSCLQR